jgi:hypothetical protein
MVGRRLVCVIKMQEPTLDLLVGGWDARIDVGWRAEDQEPELGCLGPTVRETCTSTGPWRPVSGTCLR